MHFRELILCTRGRILKNIFSTKVQIHIRNKTSVAAFEILAHKIFDKLIKNDNFNQFYLIPHPVEHSAVNNHVANIGSISHRFCCLCRCC